MLDGLRRFWGWSIRGSCRVDAGGGRVRRGQPLGVAHPVPLRGAVPDFAFLQNRGQQAATGIPSTNPPLVGRLTSTFFEKRGKR